MHNVITKWTIVENRTLKIPLINGIIDKTIRDKCINIYVIFTRIKYRCINYSDRYPKYDGR